MARDRYLILMAAGSGTRMGVDLPKQFIELNGKAVLHRTIERFVDQINDIKIITVLPEAYVDWWKDYCYRRNLFYTQILVKGGITRFHSVKNALEKVPSGALVAIHDGVRPFVSAKLVEALYKEAEISDAAIPVTPCVDTMKALKKIDGPDGHKILVPMDSKIIDREHLFGAQTPQVFKSELIKNAYELPYDPSFTDDASVAQAKGINLSYLMGERFNIKLTSKDDLILAQALLSVSF